jgi:hypothetical protein
MDTSEIPILIDGPNFINRILEYGIDKDLISAQLSFEEFRALISHHLSKADIPGMPSIVEFVCSKKLFGSGKQKFSQNERDEMLERLMHEKGVHIEVVDLPGSSEKGVDNMVTTKLESFSATFHTIILVSHDRDYVPVMRKMREKGIRIILVSFSQTIPKELVNEAYFTVALNDQYHCLFRYDYPQFFVTDDFTIAKYKQLISGADDRTNNQLRVNTNGLIYISHRAVGNQDLAGVQFRFETYGAFNGYVGPKAASDPKYVKREYDELMLAWKHRKEIDDYIDYPVKSMIDQE